MNGGRCRITVRPARNKVDKEDKTIYKVVANHEEQYSIWPTNRENALGERDAGTSAAPRLLVVDWRSLTHHVPL